MREDKIFKGKTFKFIYAGESNEIDLLCIILKHNYRGQINVRNVIKSNFTSHLYISNRTSKDMSDTVSKDIPGILNSIDNSYEIF